MQFWRAALSYWENVFSIRSVMGDGISSYVKRHSRLLEHFTGTMPLRTVENKIRIAMVRKTPVAHGRKPLADWNLIALHIEIPQTRTALWDSLLANKPHNADRGFDTSA
jgi:hypothetical protein